MDQNDVARQFSLAEGRLGNASLQLPSTVQDVRFAPGSSRVLFRTSRWLHLANSAPSGLIWTDALPAPKALASARMIFGEPGTNGTATGDRVYVPVAGDGFVRLAELNFATLKGPGLFGNKDELLEEWRRKLGLSSTYE